MPTNTMVVFGAGPGIGNHVARKFASEGFNHVILLARTESRLKEDAASVAAAGSSIKVDILRVDLSDLGSIPPVLKKIDSLAEHVQVVFYNAATIRPSEVLGVAVEEIEEDFKIQTLSLYIISQHFLPRLQSLAKSQPKHKPALLVTNSHLPWDPVPPLLSLSLNKAAQANMVESFSRAFKESGVHVGLIHVEGQVSLEDKVFNPTNIAKETWDFYEAGKDLRVHIKS